jgi:hypothetical protein
MSVAEGLGKGLTAIQVLITVFLQCQYFLYINKIGNTFLSNFLCDAETQSEISNRQQRSTLTNVDIYVEGNDDLKNTHALLTVRVYDVYYSQRRKS